MIWTLLLACTTEPEPPPAPEVERPPDVLLVVLDTVRADALGTYGAERDTSPQLSAVAQAGVLFEDATSAGSWTWPTHASLFTGEPPWVHGAHFSDAGSAVKIDKHSVTVQRDELPTLAERFVEAGYDSACISGNLLLSARLPLSRGFQVVQIQTSDADTVAAATALLERERDKPLFLYVNLYGAHAPYELQPLDYAERWRGHLDPGTAPEWLAPYVYAGEATLRTHKHPSGDKPALIDAVQSGELVLDEEGQALFRDLYDAEVAKVDFELNRLLSAWNASGRGGGVVAVTGDHGEYLGERRRLDHARGVGPEVLQVPLVIAGPGLPSGQRVHTPVNNLLLHDTLLSLAGLPADTRGLLDVLEGQDAGPVVVKSWADPDWARFGHPYTEDHLLVREGPLALEMVGTRPALYDLSSDPDRLTDLAAERPQDVARLLALAPGEEHHGAPLEVDQETAEALRALGYVAD